MAAVFYHSVIHGLGLGFMIQILPAQNNKTRFFYVLYSDETWVFDQSEHAQGPIYVLNIYRYMQSCKWCKKTFSTELTRTGFRSV